MAEKTCVVGNDCIACKYDERWWIGLILEVDTVQLDAQVKFMHPPGLANTFFWPLKDDVCWVPLQQIFCKIATPITTTGRSYTITVEDFTTIINRARPIYRSADIYRSISVPSRYIVSVIYHR